MFTTYIRRNRLSKALFQKIATGNLKDCISLIEGADPNDLLQLFGQHNTDGKTVIDLLKEKDTVNLGLLSRIQFHIYRNLFISKGNDTTYTIYDEHGRKFMSNVNAAHLNILLGINLSEFLGRSLGRNLSVYTPNQGRVRTTMHQVNVTPIELLLEAGDLPAIEQIFERQDLRIEIRDITIELALNKFTTTKNKGFFDLALKFVRRMPARDRIVEGAMRQDETSRFCKAAFHRKSDQTFSPVMLAINNNNLDAVKAMLSIYEKGSKVDDKAESGIIEAIKLAAQLGQSDLILKALLPALKSPDNHKQSKAEALLTAAVHGQEAVCFAMIEAGADVNATNDLGQTPLHLAASEGHYEICERLIKAGARTNIKSSKGNTAASLAKKKNVKALLKANASTEARLVIMANAHSYKALTAEILDMPPAEIIKLAKVSLHDPNSVFAILRGEAQSGDDKAQAVLKAVHDKLYHSIDVGNTQGYFILGVLFNQTDSLLMSHQVNLQNQFTVPGFELYPLELAIECGCQTLAQNLVEFHELESRISFTPLTGIVSGAPLARALHRYQPHRQHKYLVIINALLDTNPTPPNRALRDGMTPVHLAISEPCLNGFLPHMMQHDGYLNAAFCDLNHAGKTPLMLAIDNGNVQAITTICEAYKRSKTTDPNIEGQLLLAIERAAELGKESLIFDTLLPAHKDTQAHISSLNNALFAAVEYNQHNLCSRLIKADADIDKRGPRYRTPLHQAAQNGNLDLCQQLLKAGAKFDAKDAKGKTPLQLATNKQVKALLKLEAYINELVGRNTEYSGNSFKRNLAQCLFGDTSVHRVPTAMKLEAAQALRGIIVEGKSLNTLGKHGRALRAGQLSELCQSLETTVKGLKDKVAASIDVASNPVRETTRHSHVSGVFPVNCVSSIASR